MGTGFVPAWTLTTEDTGQKRGKMPRCIQCNRSLPSADVRKLPRREAYRCKDKFACELAETNREPHTATITVTFPAKSHREAWEIIGDVTLGHYPVTVESIEAGGEVTRSKDECSYTGDDIAAALERRRYATN